MSDKEFIGPQALLRDSFSLAAAIHASAFVPEVLLVIWRGGTPIGLVIHEYLLFRGIDTQHAAVKAQSYSGIGERREPRIDYLEPVIAGLSPGSRVLVVDDIFDSGNTIRKICSLLRERQLDVRVATLYYKEASNETDIVPDYFLRKTDRWIVFPHEVMDLTPEELKTKDPFIHRLLCEGV